MIRHSEIKAQEPENRPDQSFSLAQRQPEHRPQGQGGPDRQS
jgi:hypothetical protein